MTITSYKFTPMLDGTALDGWSGAHLANMCNSTTGPKTAHGKGGFGFDGRVDADGIVKCKIYSNGTLVGVAHGDLDAHFSITPIADGAAALVETAPNVYTLARPTGETVTYDVKIAGNIPSNLECSVIDNLNGNGNVRVSFTAPHDSTADYCSA